MSPEHVMNRGPRRHARVALCLFVGLTVGALACARWLPGGGAEVRPAPPKLADLGPHSHTISTDLPLAQRYFDQGLKLSYGFNHGAAIRAYQEAARLDPDCARCWWGVAYALGPNINAPMGPEAAAQAWQALQKAQALAPRAGERDRAYIAALARRYAANPTAERAPLDRAYADAMREVRKAYPDDIDAAVLSAEALMDLSPWQYWSEDGAPGPNTTEIVEALEWAMERDPQHPGANHFYIHAVEASRSPERAEAAADRLAGVAPDQGHLVHMPSHIYFRIGRYQDALEINQRAAKADERWFAWCQSPADIYRGVYYPHNVHFLWSAAMFEGRSDIALSSARKLSAKISDEILAAMPSTEEFRPVPYVTLARFGQWDAILGEPRPDPKLRYVTGLWHYARGLAYTRKGQPDAAGAEREKLAAVAAEPALADLVFPGGSAAQLLTLARLQLDGERAAARGDFDSAVHTLEQAVALQDDLPYTEPPPFYMPVRQTLGAVLLEAGRADEAIDVYQADLRHHPRNGWSLFGLGRAFEAKGRADQAEYAERGFNDAWARADVSLRTSRF